MPVELRSLIEDQATAEAKANPKKILGQLADLLERNGISVEEIGRVHRINMWQGFSKNADGVQEKIDLAGIQLSPKWAEGPEWPVIQPAKPCIVRVPRITGPTKPQGQRRTVILPDPQIGFRRFDDGSLDPMHDDVALAANIALISLVKPDRIVNLGDFLDLAEWSYKFVQYPEFAQTTQAALDRGHQFLAEQREVAGADCEIDYIEGNHSLRMATAITKNAMAALRLRRASAPESWPVMSIPHLLRFDELDIKYIGGYPAGRIKVADAHGIQTALYAIHGQSLDMAKLAKKERQSYIQGHTHKVAHHTETYEVDGNPEQVQTWSMGCACRLDGAVPSTNGGVDSWGKPVKRYESWQHAAGVVTETENGWWIEPVMINNGHALFRGIEINV